MKIYLACPYTQNPELGFKSANRKAAELMADGHIVFSPISHSHPIYIQSQSCPLRLPSSLDFWMIQDMAFIEWADEIYVLQICGWEESQGVKCEIEYALFKNKKIIFVDP